MTGLDRAPIVGRLDAAYDDGSWTDPALGAFLNDVGALLAEIEDLRADLDEARNERDQLRVRLRNAGAFIRQITS